MCIALRHAEEHGAVGIRAHGREVGLRRRGEAIVVRGGRRWKGIGRGPCWRRLLRWLRLLLLLSVGARASPRGPGQALHADLVLQVLDFLFQLGILALEILDIASRRRPAGDAITGDTLFIALDALRAAPRQAVTPDLAALSAAVLVPERSRSHLGGLGDDDGPCTCRTPGPSGSSWPASSARPWNNPRTALA